MIFFVVELSVISFLITAERREMEKAHFHHAVQRKAAGVLVTLHKDIMSWLTPGIQVYETMPHVTNKEFHGTRTKKLSSFSVGGCQLIH